MATEVIITRDEEHWLELRTKDLTSTDVAALFGLSPYKTAFELFHEKREGKVIKLAPNERMKWGNRFESAIAHGVAEDNEWTVQPLKAYMRDPILRIGSSFDFEITSLLHGKCILEIKNVDSLQYKRKWRDDGAGGIEAPEHIELQIQHQMLVSGYNACALVAMVGGNSPKVTFRKFDADIGVAIARKAAAFWASIEANEPPSADYTRDAELISQIYSQVNQGEVYDAWHDVELASLVSNYQAATTSRDHFDGMATKFKAQIVERVKTAEKVVGEFGSINLSRTKDTAATVITADMVGKTYGGRAGYRQFKFTPAKKD
jgi:putative phage-type endonuclease